MYTPPQICPACSISWPWAIFDNSPICLKCSEPSGSAQYWFDLHQDMARTVGRARLNLPVTHPHLFLKRPSLAPLPQGYTSINPTSVHNSLSLVQKRKRSGKVLIPLSFNPANLSTPQLPTPGATNQIKLPHPHFQYGGTDPRLGEGTSNTAHHGVQNQSGPTDGVEAGLESSNGGRDVSGQMNLDVLRQVKEPYRAIAWLRKNYKPNSISSTRQVEIYTHYLETFENTPMLGGIELVTLLTRVWAGAGVVLDGKEFSVVGLERV